MKRIYLLSTEHLEDGLWFRDEEDFKVAMNYVAIEAARHPYVGVLAFILMSNHVHFVLKGTRKDVKEFVERFKHRYSIYYRKKYGVKQLLKHNGLDIKLIPYDDEAVEKAIAYTLMNSVVAGICAHASQYPWGSGAMYFGQPAVSGTRVKNLSARALKRLLHTDEDAIPGEWIIGQEGYILPHNYVDCKGVEALFRTPQRLNYFLNSSSKARKRLEYADSNLPAFRDQTILATLPDLLRSLFHKDTFGQLLPEEQVELARQIRFRFSADATQIARVCGITYAEAAHLLDSM
ncbi:MAG: transposase [Bacteroidales bacterium]|nr:transposase [Bacteroidales bacterium]MBR5925473.1 transposase [Bacteroidales bacterium]